MTLCDLCGSDRAAFGVKIDLYQAKQRGMYDLPTSDVFHQDLCATCRERLWRVILEEVAKIKAEQPAPGKE